MARSTINVATGPNGAGKSNVDRALRLLGDVVQDPAVKAEAVWLGETLGHSNPIALPHGPGVRVRDAPFKA
ncbi:hypothetical protein [Aquidulcibacter paucihalophilus]|uniref:hypothetical protein n=1 Tax=Aquidulcibacter paucihalophilus TaxID=1978549 RepID=UPI000A197463|nr:hypothetical protein [Aquidulcibacter paucihalophilus]